MKQGWQTKSLGELCAIELGKTPARANRAYWDEKRETGNVWLSIADLLNAEESTVVDSKEYVSDKGAAVCKRVRRGTLLVSFKLTLGRLAFAGRDVYTNEAIAALTPCNERELSKEFLFYCLTFFDWVKAAENDVKLKGMTLNKAKLKAIPVAFPPLSEQQRIVALLNEAFEGIATAKANAERNLQNARALFESHLNAVFTRRGQGWVVKRLAEIADFRNGLNFTRQSRGQTVRMVGVGDFQERSFVPIEMLQSVTIDGQLSDDHLVRRDDILMVRSNGSKDLIGRCMLVPDVDRVTSFSGFIIRIRFDTHALSPRFLLLFMKSSATRDRLTRDGGGASISNINQAKLSELPISLPSFKQQEDVASRLGDLREETERLGRHYERKLAALEALKKSLLHQAFTGAT